MDTGGLLAVLEGARRRGAAAAEALVVTRSTSAWRTHRGRLVEGPRAAATEVWLRVWTGDGRSAKGRVGGADAVDGLLRRAGSGGAPGPVERLVGGGSALSIHDPRWGRISAEDRADALLTAERTVRQADRSLSPADFEYTEELRTREYGNTHGVRAVETDTTFACRGEVRGGEVRRAGEVRSRTFSTVASVPLGWTLARRAAEVSGRGTAHRGPALVVASPELAARWLDFVALALLAGRAPAGAVLDPRLHLLDDPSLVAGLRSTAFDDAAVRPGRVVLGGDGAGLRSYPAAGREHEDGRRPTNLVVRGGARTAADARAVGGTVIVLDELEPGALAEDGAVDGVGWGSVYEGGDRVGALRGSRVVGDLWAALRTAEPLAECERVGHVDTPALLVRGFELRESLTAPTPARTARAPGSDHSPALPR